MKIGFVINALGNGGAERVASILANEWTKLGHNVTFYCTHAFEQQVYYTEQSVVIKKIREKNRSGYFKLLKKLKKEFLKDDLDIVVSFMTTPSFYAYFACKKAKIPLVCSERNNPYMFPQSKIKRAVRQFTFSRADYLVCQTKDAQSFFNKKIQEKSTIISNPCDNNFPPRSKNINKTIVSAGRLDGQKDFVTLIKGFAKFAENNNEYKLEIYGDGVEKENLENLINELGLSQRCKINPFAKNIREIIANSAIFVSSSLFEGMPNVLLEALAIGTPCVATDCPIGGSRLLMEDNHFGELIKVLNPNQLGEALIKITNNYDYYNSGALQYSESIKNRFNSTVIAKQWLEVFERCIKNGRR